MKQFRISGYSAAIAIAALCGPLTLRAQQSATVPLPDAPDAAATLAASPATPDSRAAYATLDLDPMHALFGTPDTAAGDFLQTGSSTQSSSQSGDAQRSQITQGNGQPQKHEGPCPAAAKGVELDANCNPIPIEQQQPKRILGFMPNFRSVSAGAKPIPPGWKQNFKVATRQAFDASSFLFLGITSLSAEGINEHPTFGKGVDGFWKYTWHGFLDKTDGTYLGAWLLPSLLHEDTRYYALGKNSGHGYVYRLLYVASRQVVTRTYSGHDFPNIAGLGAKVATQAISRTYYPANSATFGVLAEKFAYSSMRDILFTSIREFYPDLAGAEARHKATKAARIATRDAATAAAGQSTTNPTGTPVRQ